jgi:hypothetical protein
MVAQISSPFFQIFDLIDRKQLFIFRGLVKRKCIMSLLNCTEMLLLDIV